MRKAFNSSARIRAGNFVAAAILICNGGGRLQDCVLPDQGFEINAMPKNPAPVALGEWA